MSLDAIKKVTRPSNSLSSDESKQQPPQKSSWPMRSAMGLSSWRPPGIARPFEARAMMAQAEEKAAEYAAKAKADTERTVPSFAAPRRGVWMTPPH
jgi:hypothetical protein